MATFRRVLGLWLVEDRRVKVMKAVLRSLGWFVAVGILSVGLAAETSGVGRYDQAIQAKVTHQLAGKGEFRNVQAAVEDGIVTLSGNVELFQQKLEAAEKIRKDQNVQGVRNLIEVKGKAIADAELAALLDRKLYYDRMGQGNQFNFMTASVEDGVVTLTGEAWNDVDRDSAVNLVNRVPGVKDVVNDIKVAPPSPFDDGIRVRAMRAIYRDPFLNRYALDPGKPIRIVVDRGTLSLYGVVGSAAEKQVAGMRASQVFGAFTVENNLQVAGKS